MLEMKKILLILNNPKAALESEKRLVNQML